MLAAFNYSKLEDASLYQDNTQPEEALNLSKQIFTHI
jgi:hypothetical protein